MNYAIGCRFGVRAASAVVRNDLGVRAVKSRGDPSRHQRLDLSGLQTMVMKSSGCSPGPDG
jgi:hypothetical protein